MTDEGRALFTVIICTRNEEGFIGRCLDSVLANTYPHDRMDVIVCDGRSTDGTRAVVERLAAEHECVRLLDNPNRTAPYGFNLGIAEAKGEIVAILGAHAEVAPDWIERNVRALAEHPEADAVGGRMTTVGKGTVGTAIALALSSPFGVGNNSFRVGGKARAVDTVVFGAYRRETFEKFGGFDEELARNQDDEINYRINAGRGRLWFDPEIRTTYYARPSLGGLYRQYAQYGFWKPLVYRKCPGIFGWRQLVPPAFVLTLLGLFVAGWPWPLAWAGLGGVVGLYLIGGTAFAFRACARPGLRYVPVLLLVFLLIHVAYGLHFLLGAVRFLVLRRGAAGRHAALTR